MAGACGAARNPISKVPVRPPTMCTPTTSRASSKPNLNFSPTASAHIAPPSAPTTIAPRTLTDEQDGVIATRPATMPEAAPNEVGCPSRIFSTRSQASMAVAVATVVVTNVDAATPPELRADPALKPYQPNHSNPAPSITKGKLCGRIGLPGQP